MSIEQFWSASWALETQKCVCPQKSKSPWQCKLKSAILEVFVDLTLIKVMFLVPEHPVERHCWQEAAVHLALPMSTHKVTWRRCFPHGRPGFREISMFTAFPAPGMAPGTCWILGNSVLKYWLGDFLLVHPQFPDFLPTLMMKQKKWNEKAIYKQEMQGMLWAK